MCDITRREIISIRWIGAHLRDIRFRLFYWVSWAYCRDLNLIYTYKISICMKNDEGVCLNYVIFPYFFYSFTIRKEMRAFEVGRKTFCSTWKILKVNRNENFRSARLEVICLLPRILFLDAKAEFNFKAPTKCNFYDGGYSRCRRNSTSHQFHTPHTQIHLVISRRTNFIRKNNNTDSQTKRHRTINSCFILNLAHSAMMMAKKTALNEKD